MMKTYSQSMQEDLEPIESNRFSEEQKKLFVDIDETICFYEGKRIYELAIPKQENIDKINKFKDDGWHITYWTGRGGTSQRDLYDFTIKQLESWGCKFDDLIVGYREDKPSKEYNLIWPTKPHFDLLIDDKSKRIEEIDNMTNTTYKCEECGITEHNNKPIKLQLEHIDGDKKNIDMGNIRFLCPNCNSQIRHSKVFLDQLYNGDLPIG